MTTPILGIEEVTGGQANQYLIYNAALRALEASQNDVFSVSLGAGSAEVEPEDFVRHFMFVGAGHTVAQTITFSANKRQFAVRNAGAAALTVKIGTGEVSVPAGSAYLFYADGEENGLYRVG